MSDKPIRLFHGSADDYVPVAPCRSYVELEEKEIGKVIKRRSPLSGNVRRHSRSENLNWELWLRDPDVYMIVLTSPGVEHALVIATSTNSGWRGDVVGI